MNLFTEEFEPTMTVSEKTSESNIWKSTTKVSELTSEISISHDSVTTFPASRKGSTKSGKE